MCWQPQRSTPSSEACSCDNLYARIVNIYRAQGLTAPIAVGVPIATNVMHVRDARPWQSRAPKGRLVYVHTAVSLEDMEEVD